MSDINFIPKVCNTCGSSEFNKNGRCAPCARRHTETYRAKNPEKAKAASKKWRDANKSSQAEHMSQWKAKNAEHVRQYRLAYDKKNILKVRARSAVYREANRQKIREWQKNFKATRSDKVAEHNRKYYKSHSSAIKRKVIEWQKENPEACRIKGNNRRAMKQKAGGALSKGLAEKLFALQRGMCPCCRKPLGKNYHLDHIVPLSRGGLNVDSNIQLLRDICNHQKHAKHPVEFMQSRGFLL